LAEHLKPPTAQQIQVLSGLIGQFQVSTLAALLLLLPATMVSTKYKNYVRSLMNHTGVYSLLAKQMLTCFMQGIKHMHTTLSYLAIVLICICLSCFSLYANNDIYVLYIIEGIPHLVNHK